MSSSRTFTAVVVGLFMIVAGAMSFTKAQAVEVDFNFLGKAGSGLLPLNEVGNNTPVSVGAGPSVALGSETGTGLVYDTVSKELDFSFSFSGLSGGLFNAASGIHFHLADPGVDPMNETGGIAINLNSGGDARVTYAPGVSPIVIGATGGSLAGTVTGFSAAEEASLFAGQFYLNIHSGGFNGGELRGNLVPIPEPTSGLLLLAAGLGVLTQRRRA